MQSTPITFDQLPTAVYELGRKVDDLTGLLKAMTSQQIPSPDRWFAIEELSEYLPGRPAVTTLYGKVQRREIPFSRNGKRLVFRQSEIDAWLQKDRVKTATELDSLAEQHLLKKSSSHKLNKQDQKGGQLL
ncbi:helix-turn-helix domain-containing protein [Spirosoma sp. KCTC 42546]|uniref:helix-turn-helix domain-containing protein n=1 Tax=Spirosoma sp. KCTC 42546 TaxID=2520506 RepID=UPI00115C272C|nr:helix-turn-helix domain-containing protein [Spirosoma sp. KCTC 42546]QDK81562.1 helix-turn-helix domain-containing protein [Spirosoma sp. KCTC 42546]